MFVAVTDVLYHFLNLVAAYLSPWELYLVEVLYYNEISEPKRVSVWLVVRGGVVQRRIVISSD